MMLWTLLTYIVKDSELFPAQLLLLPSRFSCVQLCATPWTVACQGPLSMEFSRQSTKVGCHALLQGLFQPRDQTHVSHIAGGFFTIWAIRESQEGWSG